MMTALDQALMAANTNENERVAYYNLFLNSVLYIPTHDIPKTEQRIRASDQEQINPIFVEANGLVHLMLFDTVERLTAWAQQEVGYVGIPGHAIVEMMMGSNYYWVLNANTEYAKVFNPDEIQWLQESFSSSQSQKHVVPEGSQIMIQAPLSLPEGLVETLQKNLSTRNEEIKEAYLVEFTYTANDQTPHLTLVLLGNPANNTVSEAIQKDIFMATNKFFNKDQSFDILFDNGEMARQIMKTIPPFYVSK